MFSSTNGSLFGVVQVDLAEYSTVVPDSVTVPFFGYRFDGSVVTTNFITDGIIDGTGPTNDFQTFYFGPEFTNLIRVEIPTYGWSLDNLVVYPILQTKIFREGATGKPLLRFHTFANWNYSVEYSPDLSSGSWSNLLGTNITGNGSDVVLVDTNVTMSVNRFYRLKLVPQ